MAIKISGTTVIDDSRNLCNINNINADNVSASIGGTGGYICMCTTEAISEGDMVFAAAPAGCTYPCGDAYLCKAEGIKNGATLKNHTYFCCKNSEATHFPISFGCSQCCFASIYVHPWGPNPCSKDPETETCCMIKVCVMAHCVDETGGFSTECIWEFCGDGTNSCCYVPASTQSQRMHSDPIVMESCSGHKSYLLAPGHVEYASLLWCLCFCTTTQQISLIGGNPARYVNPNKDWISSHYNFVSPDRCYYINWIQCKHNNCCCGCYQCAGLNVQRIDDNFNVCCIWCISPQAGGSKWCTRCFDRPGFEGTWDSCNVHFTMTPGISAFTYGCDQWILVSGHFDQACIGGSARCWPCVSGPTNYWAVKPVAHNCWRSSANFIDPRGCDHLYFMDAAWGLGVGYNATCCCCEYISTSGLKCCYFNMLLSNYPALGGGVVNHWRAWDAGDCIKRIWLPMYGGGYTSQPCSDASIAVMCMCVNSSTCCLTLLTSTVSCYFVGSCNCNSCCNWWFIHQNGAQACRYCFANQGFLTGGSHHAAIGDATGGGSTLYGGGASWGGHCGAGGPMATLYNAMRAVCLCKGIYSFGGSPNDVLGVAWQNFSGEAHPYYCCIMQCVCCNAGCNGALVPFMCYQLNGNVNGAGCMCISQALTPSSACLEWSMVWLPYCLNCTRFVPNLAYKDYQGVLFMPGAYAGTITLRNGDAVVGGWERGPGSGSGQERLGGCYQTSGVCSGMYCDCETLAVAGTAFYTNNWKRWIGIAQNTVSAGQDVIIATPGTIDRSSFATTHFCTCVNCHTCFAVASNGCCWSPAVCTVFGRGPSGTDTPQLDQFHYWPSFSGGNQGGVHFYIQYDCNSGGLINIMTQKGRCGY